VEALALPIPENEVSEAIECAGFDANVDACAVMAVLYVAPNGGEATVNLLAPIIVNAQTRRGAQVVLEKSSFTTSEPLLLLKPEPKLLELPREATVRSATAIAP
jgi:flagellar assembly factor FliW